MPVAAAKPASSSTRLIEATKQLALRAQHRLRQESGQAMVLSVTALTAILGMGAVSIDLSTWYQHHHGAQVAADSAALAAANCLADGGVGQTCTSTTDYTDATNVATAYAADNGATIPSSDVSFANGSVTVTTAETSPPLFARMFGIGATKQSTQAVASYQQQSNICDSTQAAAGSCVFAYAQDSDCPDVGMTLENVGTASVTGAIWSNSDLETINADNHASFGPTYYGNGNLCSWIGATVTTGTGPSFASGPAATSAYSGWPRDFRTYLACGPSDTYQCTGPDGTPSYCTQAAPAFGLTALGIPTNVSTLVAKAETVTANQVYCAYGTSGNKSDPSTWDGVIDMTNASTNMTDSFIGGNVTLVSTSASNVTLGPELDTPLGHVLVYANDPVEAANVANAGSASINGDVFAPNGIITASSAGSGTFLSFLEGWQVVIDAQGQMVGQGPITSTFSGPTDSLVQ